jgi:5,10-methylenetetrahydromethanopterin reductase
VSFPWGVWFEPTQPVPRLVDLAHLAEGLGAEVCFVADEGTERDVYVALTAILLGTERLVVAPAITNPFSRHPVTTAAAVATLAELAPGRVWHGLGVGGSRVLEPLGLAPERPFTALREALAVQRDLLAGRPSGPAVLPWVGRGVEGASDRSPAGPVAGPSAVPIAVAGRGPRVQALAAAAADWVILSAKPLAHLAAERARIRAAGTARVAWSAYLAYSDEERARVLRHFSYMAVDAPPDIRAAAGLDDERAAAVKAAMLSGDMDRAARLLPPSLVDQYAVAGTPDACAAAIAAHRRDFDLFALPMNDEATCEAHITASAAILAEAQRLSGMAE